MSELERLVAVATGAEGEEIVKDVSAKDLAEALPPPQRAALTLLSNGEPIRVAAEKAGVNRGTLYRWIKGDAYFRAAYNAWQQEHRESCRLGLLKCGEKAVARIVEMVQYDRNLAFKVVKELGLFKGSQSLTVEPRRVEQEIRIEELEEGAQLDQRQFEHMMAMGRRRVVAAQVSDAPASANILIKGASSTQAVARG